MQRKFLKHVLFVHKNNSTDIVYSELGEYLIDVINSRIISFGVKFNTGKTTKLS